MGIWKDFAGPRGPTVKLHLKKARSAFNIVGALGRRIGKVDLVGALAASGQHTEEAGLFPAIFQVVVWLHNDHRELDLLLHTALMLVLFRSSLPLSCSAKCCRISCTAPVEIVDRKAEDCKTEYEDGHR
jgi:hypothetical protein